MIPSGRCSICLESGHCGWGASSNRYSPSLHVSCVLFSDPKMSREWVWAGCWAPVSCGKPIWNSEATPGVASNVYDTWTCPIQESHMMDSSWDLTQLRQEVKWSIPRFVVLRECNQIMYISDFQFCADKILLLVDLDLIPEHSSYPSKQQLTNHPNVKIKKKYRKHEILDVLVQDTGKHVFFDP